MVTSWKPHRVNWGPNSAATSGRSAVSVVAATNTGAPNGVPPIDVSLTAQT